MSQQLYAVVPGEHADADVLPGTLGGLCAAIMKAQALSKDGPPRVIRKGGEVIKWFENGVEVRDGQVRCV